MGGAKTNKSWVNGETAVYGIIGNPISHSLSPIFWNGAFRSLGMNAIYVPFCVDFESDVCDAMNGLRNLFNNGMPF